MPSVIGHILSCTAEPNATAAQLEPLGRLMARVADKDRLVHTAAREGMAGLLYKNLMQSGMLDRLNGSQAARLQSIYQDTARLNLKRIHDVKQLLRRMGDRGDRLVLLKGMVLLQRVYTDIGLREMTDIDLWVLKKDSQHLIHVLLGLGYTADPVYPNTFRKGPTTVDMHTHLLGADRIRARRMLLDKNQDRIFYAAQRIRFEGQGTRCLNPYDQVIYLGLHALKHNVDKLILLVDLKGVMAGWTVTDWRKLASRAREMGQEKTIGYITYLLDRSLGFRPPDGADRLDGIHDPYPWEKSVLRQRINKGRLPVYAPVLFFSPAKGIGRRCRFVLESVFPRPEVLRQIFPDRRRQRPWQLYLSRAAQIAGKAAVHGTGALWQTCKKKGRRMSLLLPLLGYCLQAATA